MEKTNIKGEKGEEKRRIERKGEESRGMESRVEKR